MNTDGDSIVCKIFKIRNGFIYYAHVVEKKPVRSTIETTNVSFYKANFYDNRDVIKYFPKEDWGRGRIAFSGNWSYRLGTVDPSLDAFEKKYLQKLKSGIGFSMEAAYLFNKHLGVGFAVQCASLLLFCK